MPRLHLGQGNGRRPGRAAAAGSGPAPAAAPPSVSSSSRPRATRDAAGARDALDFDFDDDDEVFDGAGGAFDFHDGKGGRGGGVGGKGGDTGSSTTRPQKSSLDALRDSSSDSSSSDSSSDSDEEPLVRKSTAARKKSGAGIVGAGSGGGKKKASAAPSVAGRRRKITATSPVITVADLAKPGRKKKGHATAKANANNADAKSKAQGKKPVGKPVGKPISKCAPKKKSVGGRRKTAAANDNDENVENAASTTAKQGRGTKAGGKRKGAPGQNQQPQKKGSQPKASAKAHAAKNSKKKKQGAMLMALVDSDSEVEISDEESMATSRGRRGDRDGEGGHGRRKKRASVSKSKSAKGRRLEESDSEKSSDEEEEATMAKHRKQRKGRTANPTAGIDGSGHGGTAKQPQQLPVLPHRAVAVDNRTFPTVAAESLARSAFLAHLPGLIQNGVARGVLSLDCDEGAGTVVASLGKGTKRVRGEGGGRRGKGRAGDLVEMGIVPRARALAEGLEIDGRVSWLTDFVAPVNNGGVGGSTERSVNLDDGTNAMGANGFDYGAEDILDVANRGLVGGAVPTDAKYSGPAGFAAEDSWGCFGDLVEAIEGRLADNASHADQARHVTLFTTDANLFADVRSSSHGKGLERFWERIQSSSSSSSRRLLAAVTVVLVETTTAVQVAKTIGGGSSIDDSAMFDESGGREESSVAFGATSSLLPNRLRIIQCVNDIRRRIHELNEARLESSDDGVPPIDLRLDFLDGNAVSFHGVLQHWANESFARTFASPGAHGRLRFDLPETLDGTTCSIALDLMYTVLPHPLHSSRTGALVEDMHGISRLPPSSVEVVQAMPLSSVDASLIYGVPMAAVAGAEGDASRHDEMRMLTRQLWRYLGRNDAALVLRARMGASEDVGGGLTSDSLGCDATNEQLFLLVCEEAVQKPPALNCDSNLDPTDALKTVPDASRRGEAPCQGVLYRYATKSQVLRFGNEGKGLEPPEGDSDEVSEQYLDYIERSLETLVNTGLNPLLMGRES